jgi:hypothetical protein
VDILSVPISTVEKYVVIHLPLSTRREKLFSPRLPILFNLHKPPRACVCRSFSRRPGTGYDSLKIQQRICKDREK